jgi:signal transduction histidine kinase
MTVIGIALVGISALSILLVYTSLQSTESRLSVVAIQNLRKDTAELANDAAIDLTSSLDIISRRLQTAATSPVLLAGVDSDGARALLDATRVGMEQYTRRINYLDKDGILRYTTEDELLNEIGSDRANTSYYAQTRGRDEPVLTELFTTMNNQSGVSIAVPVKNSSGGEFGGVLAAVIPVQSLTDSISARLPVVQNRVLIVAADGTIVSQNGRVAFGDSILNQFTASQSEIVNRNLQFMEQGRSGNFEYISPDGERRMIAYSPVTFSGSHVWSVVITTPITQNETFTAVLNDQRILTILSIMLIAAVAVIFIILILTLNKRLHRIVLVQDRQIRNQLTDLQVAYERLTEQDKIKEEFINIAAHELRTPVLPIILSAEGLEEELDGNNFKIDIIIRNAKRINKLTNDILDVSRINSNTFRLQKERINILTLVEETVQDALVKMTGSKNANVKIVFNSMITADQEEILADRGRINQVLVNLIDNAINFTEQGTITLTLQRVKDHIEIRVADTGRGIDPIIMPKLFGKFVTRSENQKGTGLGLYLSKSIIEAHGGTIWAEANNEAGRGAVFIFRLPA